MAKQIGIIKLNGTIGGICFYSMNGIVYARQKSTLSGKRIKTDPKFKRSLENANEFGWSAKLGKIMRSYMQPLKSFMDNSIHFRLQLQFNKIIQLGSGVRGKRDLNVLMHKALLQGFDFHKTDILPSRLYVPLHLQTTAQRNEVILSLPEFSPSRQIKSPAGATHYRIVLYTFAFSNFKYVDSSQRYEPVVNQAIGLNALQYSAYLDLKQTASPMQLHANIGSSVILDPNESLIVTVGLEFYQQINGIHYPLDEGQVMRVIDVF